MGPCLCGDPYCPRCGNPAAAELEEAEQACIDAFSDFNVAEYEMAKKAGVDAVKKHREQYIHD